MTGSPRFVRSGCRKGPVAGPRPRFGHRIRDELRPSARPNKLSVDLGAVGNRRPAGTTSCARSVDRSVDLAGAIKPCCAAPPLTPAAMHGTPGSTRPTLMLLAMQPIVLPPSRHTSDSSPRFMQFCSEETTIGRPAPDTGGSSSRPIGCHRISCRQRSMSIGGPPWRDAAASVKCNAAQLWTVNGSPSPLVMRDAQGPFFFISIDMRRPHVG